MYICMYIRAVNISVLIYAINVAAMNTIKYWTYIIYNCARSKQSWPRKGGRRWLQSVRREKAECVCVRMSLTHTVNITSPPVSISSTFSKSASSRASLRLPHGGADLLTEGHTNGPESAPDGKKKLLHQLKLLNLRRFSAYLTVWT